MITENQDPFAIPRPQMISHPPAQPVRARGRRLAQLDKKRKVRRGEREERNLLRRRRIRIAEQMLVSACVVAILVFSVAAWQTGAVARTVDVLAARLGNMLVSAGLTVEEVRVSGQHQLPAADLRQALDLSTGVPIFNIDLDELRTRIEALGWVEQASVSRRMPNGLLIDITERVPFALWQDQGQLWVVDAAGIRLTNDNIDQYGKLPMVVGQGAAQHAADLVTVLQGNPDLFSRVKSAVRVADRRWDLVFDSGVRVRLPEGALGAPFARLDNLQRQTKILERNVAIVDLRFDGRVIVRLDHQVAEAELRAPAVEASVKTDTRHHGGEI